MRSYAFAGLVPTDMVAKSIVFPQVSPGARAVVHYRIAQKKPVLPGHFSAIEFASQHDERRDVTHTVIAPADMPMQGLGIDLSVDRGHANSWPSG